MDKWKEAAKKYEKAVEAYAVYAKKLKELQALTLEECRYWEKEAKYWKQYSNNLSNQLKFSKN